MQALQKILLLLLVVPLPLDSVVEMGSSYSWAAIDSTEHSQVLLDNPTGNPNFFAIHHHAENPAEVTNQVPQPQPTSERKYELVRSSAPESVIERWLIFSIRFGGLIEPGLTILKLIFPFHFFL